MLAPAAPFSVIGEFERIVRQQTPGFDVEARLSKADLRIDRDELVVSISSSRDGFFYVLTLAPDGLLVQYFPNQQAPTNRITAGQSLTLPPTSARSAHRPDGGRADADRSARDAGGCWPSSRSIRATSARSGTGGSPTTTSTRPVRRPKRWPAGSPAAAPLYLGRPVCPAGDACADEYGADLVEFSAIR